MAGQQGTGDGGQRQEVEMEEHELARPEAPGFELIVPARAENVAVVRHAFGGLGDAMEVHDGVLADVKLAVTEACTNVVVHAYPEAGGDMTVRAAVLEDHLRVTVVDEGRGIVPRPDSPGLGLGLPLIATLADTLELGSGTDQGAEVRMTFPLQGLPGGAPQ